MVHSHAMSSAGFGASADCKFQSRLGPYVDGELNAEQEAEIEAHLGACDACRAEVGEIRELSHLAGAISTDGMSVAAIRRIHQAVDADQRLIIFRVAGILTGLAASVLVIGSAWMAEFPGAAQRIPAQTIVIDVEHAKAWEQVALGREPLPTGVVEWDDRSRLAAESSMASSILEGLQVKSR